MVVKATAVYHARGDLLEPIRIREAQFRPASTTPAYTRDDSIFVGVGGAGGAGGKLNPPHQEAGTASPFASHRRQYVPPFSLRSSRLEAATIRPARSGPSTMTGGPRPRGTTPRRTTRTRRPVGPRSRHTRHDAKLKSGRDTRDAWIDGRQAFIYKSLRSRAFFGRPHGCRASTPQRFRRVQSEA